MSYSLRGPAAAKTGDWRDVVRKGFDSFDAQVGTTSADKSESCEAKIWYRQKRKWTHITGATGHGAGHAEMHALSQFITNICSNKVSKFRALQDEVENKSGVRVECESKPCCVYCSAILGLLGITPKDKDTKKSPDRMGSTQWGMTSSLRSFVSDVSDYPEAILAMIDGRV